MGVEADWDHGKEERKMIMKLPFSQTKNYK